MAVVVRVCSEADTPSHTNVAIIYRIEAVDDSGQPSMAGPWKLLRPGVPAEEFVARGSRMVIEQYDKDRHGRI